MLEWLSKIRSKPAKEEPLPAGKPPAVLQSECEAFDQDFDPSVGVTGRPVPWPSAEEGDPCGYWERALLDVAASWSAGAKAFSVIVDGFEELDAERTPGGVWILSSGGKSGQALAERGSMVLWGWEGSCGLRLHFDDGVPSMERTLPGGGSEPISWPKGRGRAP